MSITSSLDITFRSLNIHFFTPVKDVHEQTRHSPSIPWRCRTILGYLMAKPELDSINQQAWATPAREPEAHRLANEN